MKKVKNVTYYRCTGFGAFPLDMLRYDGAFIAPACVFKESNWQPVKADSYIIASVQFTGSYKARVTRDRWASFGWRLQMLDVNASRGEDIGGDWVTFECSGPHRELEPVTLAQEMNKP
jgi:hypothetical protein